MKRSRQFRPVEPIALEDRIAPSRIAGGGPQAGGHAKPTPQVRAVAHPSARSAAGAKPTFAQDIAGTLAAGLPVNEQRTTRYGDGSTQTETRLIQPNTTNNSTLTTQTIQLRNNGGRESVNDFSYLSIAGATIHVITTTLPDGSLRIENDSLQVSGDTTQIQGTLKLPNGGVVGVTGTSVVRGALTTTDKAFTEPDGTVDHEHTVTVRRGDTHETVTDTLTRANGTHQTLRSSTTIVRLAPPTSTSVGTLKPGAVITPPKIV